MTGRDRMVLITVVVLAVLGGAWLMVVSPKRKEATKLAPQVAEAQTQLSAAQSQLAQARAAQKQYATAYASIVSLGKAVPASDEVPSLIYELSRATKQKNVEFNSIVATSSTTGGGGTGASSGAAGTSGPAATAGFSQMPFTFVFGGSFFDLEHLFGQLNRFTLRGASGGLQVSGRLLTIQSVKLVPASAPSEKGAKSTGPQQLSGTITATAYVLPAGQGLTGGATPSSPTAPVASTTAGKSSPTAPAIARVTP